jgi:hypothetical protein
MLTVGSAFTVTVAVEDVTITCVLALSVTCSSKLHEPVVVEPEVTKE